MDLSDEVYQQDVQHILASVQEGWVGADAAAAMLEDAQHVRAHSHAQAVQQLTDAGRPDLADEYAKLFPPSAPYEPDDDEELSGDHSFAPQRTPTVQQGGTRASAAPLSDEELFTRLYGRAPRPGELDD